MPTYNFETLILRFRDLVTGLGETIENHENIIKGFARNKYVWWGWWNKDGEQLPVNEFAYLNDIAVERGLALLLIDSGRRKAYRAQCNRISWEQSFQRMCTPEKTHTPAYYNKQGYYAWFRFLSFEEISIDELNEYSYVRVDNFFTDTTPKYVKYDNKKIYDINELIEQNRTIWFVRKSISTDSGHQIVLDGSDAFTPEHFFKDYFPMKSNRLLWLSDLHFPDNTFPEKSDTVNKSLWYRINKTFSQLEQKDINIAGLIISGDITTAGKQEGFVKADVFFNELNRSLTNTLESRSIIICPGNHDFSFSPETANICEVDEPSTINYRNFYKKINYISPNKYISCGRKFMLKNGTLVDIVSINSLQLQQFESFQGQGFIGDDQLNNAAEEMGWKENQPSKAVRIVMMHHHYLPSCYQDDITIKNPSSAVFDAERLSRWVTKYNVNILLHGHKHNMFFSKISRPIDVQNDIINDDDNSMCSYYVFGMGSTGAAHIGTNSEPNTFAILEFGIDKLEVIYYTLNPVGSERIAKRVSIKI